MSHPDIDGVLFIGSYRTGMSLASSLSSQPQKQLTLEMGGNSPLVIWSYDDIRLAVHVAIQSAFISSGQRCTAARRLIVNRAVAPEFLDALVSAVRQIRVGPALSEIEPFMGPMINVAAARKFLEEVEALVALGSRALVLPEALATEGAAYVSPGIVDTTGILVPDEEVFGRCCR